MVEPQNAAFFPTTCWSQVGPGAAGGGDGVTDRALERLASRYWRPIRDWLSAELRLERDAAAELTQDFFVWVIESDFLKKADPERGRFRAFLKVALRNYARDANRRATAARRGGGRSFFSLDGPIVVGDIASTEWLTPAHKEAHAAEGNKAFLAVPLHHLHRVQERPGRDTGQRLVVRGRADRSGRVQPGSGTQLRADRAAFPVRRVHGGCDRSEQPDLRG